MLFCVVANCTSLREVSGAMLGLSGKTKHFRLENMPYRSTLSDANKRRDSQVFGQIYHRLLHQYKAVISDSRFKDVLNRQVEIFDSATITLLQEILKSAGQHPISGKRRGRIKMHAAVRAGEAVLQVAWLTSAR
jgi:hypothetical protein